jgi:alkylated DNA repair dioxygenase AlkB
MQTIDRLDATRTARGGRAARGAAMNAIATAQGDLFGLAPALPPGLDFEAALIDAEAERELLALLATLPLRPARFKQYTARRRVFAYGSRFDFDAYRLQPRAIGELPAPLHVLRERLAAWAGVAPQDFVHVMVSEYQPGTPLGWHRDAPDYELVVGVSLAGPARLRFRPWPPARDDGHAPFALELAPRSAYAMRGVARWVWQHSVPPVPALRYSVTMRTARPGAAGERPQPSAASSASTAGSAAIAIRVDSDTKPAT